MPQDQDSHEVSQNLDNRNEENDMDRDKSFVSSPLPNLAEETKSEVASVHGDGSEDRERKKTPVELSPGAVEIQATISRFSITLPKAKMYV